MEPEGEWRSLRIGMEIDELKKTTKETKNNKNNKNIKSNNNSVVTKDDVFLWRIFAPIIE
jgi:hypothetical protein